ncbi:MAG: hypothetical protein WBD46_07595, partial [Acidobacteriaceae bacterium]
MKARSTRGLSWLCILALGALTAGCGHTIATGTATAGNSADFSLALSAPSLSVTAGGAAQSVSVSATALDGFTGAVQVTVSGAPAGVTPSPASFNLTPGAPQTVNFAAASSASAATATVQFAGAAGQLSHAASLALTVAAAAPPPPPTGTDVLTYHDDVGRTGLNAQETTLTLANVNSSQFGLLRILPVDGKVDAQPLYVSALTIGAQQHNVVYTATEHDSVYAFDADSGAQLWKTSILGSGENSSGDHGCSQISPEIGITSTPVIDRSAGAHGSIFVVGMSLDASGAYHQRLHALDITTGAELAGSPSEIRATYPGAGANSSGGNVVFDPAQYAERVGLLLQNGVLYMGWT